MEKNFLLKTTLIVAFGWCTTMYSIAQTWNLAGNAGTLASHYLGTSDGKDLFIGTNGAQRVKITGLTGTATAVVKLLGTNTYLTFGGAGAGTINWNASYPFHFRTLTNVDDLSTYTSRLTILPTTGFVGMGTVNPLVNLEVMGSNVCSRIVSSGSGSNMGMAVSDCNGCYNIENGNTILYAQRNSKMYINSGGVYNATRADLVFTSGFGNVLTNMTILGQTGQVGIGTTCIPVDGKLAVNGKIYATALQIKLTNGSGCFPDYVFSEEYKLKPLAEVEKYIQTNRHLEGIPSSAQVEQNGIDVAELNTKMLEKIEELTLYMIELKKENQQMKEQIKALGK